MQLWHGREGEVIQLGCTGLRGNFVVAMAFDGQCEILVPETDRGETLHDAIEDAKLRVKARRTRNIRQARRRSKPEA